MAGHSELLVSCLDQLMLQTPSMYVSKEKKRIKYLDMNRLCMLYEKTRSNKYVGVHGQKSEKANQILPML